jgi:hypothetical protein
MSDDRLPSVKDVRAQLVEHVGFMKRYRKPDWHLAEEIVWHRRQCLANYLDEENTYWIDRARVVEQLADAEAVSLVDEQSIKAVLGIVAERERKRREEAHART